MAARADRRLFDTRIPDALIREAIIGDGGSVALAEKIIARKGDMEGRVNRMNAVKQLWFSTQSDLNDQEMT